MVRYTTAFYIVWFDGGTSEKLAQEDARQHAKGSKNQVKISSKNNYFFILALYYTLYKYTLYFILFYTCTCFGRLQIGM